MELILDWTIVQMTIFVKMFILTNYVQYTLTDIFTNKVKFLWTALFENYNLDFLANFVKLRFVQYYRERMQL